MNDAEKSKMARNICEKFIKGSYLVEDALAGGAVAITVPILFVDRDYACFFVQCDDSGAVIISDDGGIAFHQGLEAFAIKCICQVHNLAFDEDGLGISKVCMREEAPDVLMSFFEAAIDSFSLMK